MRLQPDLFDEPTAISEALAVYMPHGFAMHTADLIEGERALVEKALDKDTLSVVFATTTLAQGLNYSFKTVFLMLGRDTISVGNKMKPSQGVTSTILPGVLDALEGWARTLMAGSSLWQTNP